MSGGEPPVENGRVRGEDVRASITAAQADRIEMFQELGLVPVPRNTFVKMAVEEKLERLAGFALQMEQVEALAAGRDEETAGRIDRAWPRTRSE